MRPYVPAMGRRARIPASRASVLRCRPSAFARASSPAPASTNRTPAPSSGGTSSSPILIVTHVDDQIRTFIAYRDQMTERGTRRKARRVGCPVAIRLPRLFAHGCLRGPPGNRRLRGVRVLLPVVRAGGDEPGAAAAPDRQDLLRLRRAGCADRVRAVQAVSITYIGFGNLKRRSA